MKSQSEKACLFQCLHSQDTPFLTPNPWDAVSARILASLGYQALATSSGAAAATLGRSDGKLSREEAFLHIRAIVEATDLPVSADLENGFGETPAAIEETIRLAAETGLVGASIEDYTGDAEKGLFEITYAAERIAAAVEAARKLSFPFTITARAENFIRGRHSLEDTITRLQAYEEAGADVLFAPALPDLESVRTVCASVSKPVNFMVGLKGKSFSVAELTTAGVRRISFASSLYRAALSALISAGAEIREKGTFGYLDHTLTTPELNNFLES